MSFRFARRAAAAVAATALTVVGCGTATELSARQGLSNALGALDDQSSLTMTLSLDVTAERLVELSEAQGEVLPIDQAELLAGSSVALTIASPDGTPLEDLDPETAPNVHLAVETPDGAVADLRVVDEDLYLQVDVPWIAELAGVSAPTTAELGVGEVPGLEFLDTLLTGGWIMADGQELADLAESLGAVPTETETEPDAGMLDQLRAKVSAAFDSSVTVTEDGSDPELGSRTLLEASPRRLLSELTGTLEGVETGQGDAADLLAPLTEDLDEVPDEPVTVAVYERDGVATGLRLDLAQFVEDGSLDDVGVLVRFDTADSGVEVPAGATKIDLQSIVAAVFSAMMPTTTEA